MMVMNNKCKKCNQVCNVIHCQQNFGDWTDSNKLTQDTQLLFYECQALKWIPYESFNNIKYIAKGGFGKVYKANWAYGEEYHNRPVALKSLNNSKNITLEFMNEV
jgi:serine/threonine protein kinase